MPHFGAWVTFAETQSLDALVEKIFTTRNATTATPDEEVATIVGDLPPGARVLDFGCGVCRNAAEYAARFPHLDVHGYDSPQMLARVGEYLRHRYGGEVPNLTLHSDWNAVAVETFDCVYATLVFQHIHPDEVRAYLEAIKGMTKLLVIRSRRSNDHSSESTWRIIESCGLAPANAAEIGYAADGDGEEHLPLCVYRL